LRFMRAGKAVPAFDRTQCPAVRTMPSAFPSGCGGQPFNTKGHYKWRSE
jgi:hypothetical protein